MSKEDQNFMTNREILRDIHTSVIALKEDMREVKTTQKLEMKKVDKMDGDIEGLKVWRNINVAGVLGALTSWLK